VWLWRENANSNALNRRVDIIKGFFSRFFPNKVKKMI